ncbi:fasciclin domain-containing protein [Echinicola vietnamensis]|uniref:Secreted/surface protein with fasciclin-like repeats n=1 Tax=Echinicola vietnamensis (strain DSM 17526 / LMG 23754 / KMM 6221) TaxID=926556 RepID=L0FXY8_ECHVK|nr:fasciclin domain-containing protein [Echinicola vietnamensis]AGA77918.1 secreted/surface protein with fasciclin-like repeats [Echinicola vietnamensis DSM 17526]
MNRRYQYFLLCLICLGAFSCGDQWEEHNEATQDLNNNLVQMIRADADLSTFASLLEQSGLDAQLASGSYTVWAPNNAALENLPESITGDKAALKAFVGNHIGYQQRLSHQAEDTLMRVKMLNDKVNVLRQNSITSVDQTANFDYADRLSKNGVLYKIDRFLEVKKNVWEIVKERSDNPVSQLITGMTITDSLTNETYNYFEYDVTDLANEDSTYTFFLLNDEAYGTFKMAMEPYFKDTLPETETLSMPLSLGLAKDLVFTTAYYDNVPDTILSVDSVKVAFHADQVVEKINASNGVVYLMNGYDYKLSDKIPEIKIEGEYYDGLSDGSGPVNIRARTWASNNRDLLVINSGIAGYSVRYEVPQAHSTKYDIYWRAVNDDYIPRTNEQRIAVDSVQNELFSLMFVVPNTYEEVYIGQHEVQNYGDLRLLLQSYPTTSNDWNSLVLDYIRLVPVFE